MDARALYPDSTLADLYDEAMTPPELRRAHQESVFVVICVWQISFGEIEEFEGMYSNEMYEQGPLLALDNLKIQYGRF